MNKIIAALKEFTIDLIIWSLLLKKPWQEHSLSLTLPRTGHLTFQQLWEWAGVISTSQIMKQDLEKWNSSPKVAQPVFELKSSHIDESARQHAASLEKITRFYYFFFPSPILSTCSAIEEWNENWWMCRQFVSLLWKVHFIFKLPWII